MSGVSTAEPYPLRHAARVSLARPKGGPVSDRETVRLTAMVRSAG